ncbi:MAG: helix-turn-helix domain-containing protein [Chloroflexota bacterium]
MTEQSETMDNLNKKKLFYRPTTNQQRNHAFQVWEATGDVERACREAKISRSTFYYWKERFEQGGYPALEEIRSRAPINPRKTNEAIEEEVIALKREHPEWGKVRIASTLSKRDKINSISPNTVRRILIDAGLWAVK